MSDEREEIVLEGRPRWTRLAAVGLVMAGLGPLLFLIAGFGWGLDVGEEIVFFGGAAAVALLGALAVWKAGTLGAIVGIVASILVGGALFWTAFGLFAPTSFFDFVPGLLVVPGILLGLIGSISSLVAKRRRNLTTSAQGGERRGIAIYVGIVVVLAALSAVLTFTSKDSVSDTEADLVVELSDFEYDMDDYEVAAGSTVLVVNKDPFLHTFTIEDLDIDVTLTPGSEKVVEIPEETGDYIVFCEPHTSDPDDPSEDDMAANITVE